MPGLNTVIEGRAPLDLATINAAQKVATDALKAYVCELEQYAIDAGLRRDYQSAKLHNDWAFAADLCIHRVSAALSQLFLEAYNAPPLHSHTTVELPSLERPATDGEGEAVKVEVLPPHSSEGLS